MALCGTMISGPRPPLHHQRNSNRDQLVCSSPSSPWSIQNPPLFPHPICRLSLTRTTTTFNPYKLCSSGSRGGGRGRIFGGRGGGDGDDDEHIPFDFDISIGFNLCTFNYVLAFILGCCVLTKYPPFDEEENFFAATRHLPVLLRIFFTDLKTMFSLLFTDGEDVKQLHLQKCPRCRRAHAENLKMREFFRKMKREMETSRV